MFLFSRIWQGGLKASVTTNSVGDKVAGRVWKRTEPTDIKHKQKESDKYSYDSHQDIWKRGVEINRRERKIKRIQQKHKKTTTILSPEEILTLYDLQQDILSMSMKQTRDEQEQRQLKKDHDDAMLSLYDLHQDIWSRGKKQKRKEDNYYAYLEKYMTKPTPDRVVPVS